MAVSLDVSKLRPPKGGGASVRTPWYDHLSDHPSNGLTPTKLTTLLRQAELGDLTAQSELYEDIADKDPTLVAVFDTRKLAVLSKPWEIIPVEGSGAKGKKQAETRRAMLENLSRSHLVSMPGYAGEYMDFESLLSYLMDAHARGFSAAVPVYDTKTWEVIAARQFAQKHFIAADVLKSGNPEYNPYELRIRTIENPANGEEIRPYEFLIHWYRGKSGLPSRMGLLRTLTWWYLFKNYAMKSWVKSAERFGMPLVLGKYDESTSDEDKEALELAVKSLGIDGGAVVSVRNQLEIIEAKGGNITGEMWEKLLHTCNMEFSKAVLGHASTTESTPGKLGAEDQAMQVQSYRTEADARALERTINQQMIDPVNVFVDGESLCYFKIRYEADEDLNSKADRYVKLITAGARIGEKHFHETFDIPIPTDDERLVQPAPDDPIAAALGGAMGGGMKNSVDAQGRVFANAALYANATKSRAGRIARKQRAMAETDALEKTYAEKLTDAYAELVKGLPVSDDAVEMIRVEEFRETFGDVVRKMIRAAMEISGAEMEMRDLVSTKAANKVDPWQVRQLLAMDWLEFQAFTLTEIETEQITVALAKRIKDELFNVVESGITPKEFYSRILDAEGIGKIGRGHLQTVLRTNIATARSSAMEIAVQQNPKAFPAWQFIAVNDNRTRESHAALDGKVFRWEDRKYWPPLGFNCRCEGSPIHETELADEGYEIASSSVQDTDVPRGFGTDTRVNYARWVDKLKRENENIRSRLETLTS